MLLLTYLLTYISYSYSSKFERTVDKRRTCFKYM